MDAFVAQLLAHSDALTAAIAAAPPPIRAGSDAVERFVAWQRMLRWCWWRRRGARADGDADADGDDDDDGHGSASERLWTRRLAGGGAAVAAVSAAELTELLSWAAAAAPPSTSSSPSSSSSSLDAAIDAAAAASVRGPLHAMRHASLVALRAVEGWGSPVLWACGVQWVRRTTVDGGARASTTRYPVTLTVALRAPAWRGRACTLEQCLEARWEDDPDDAWRLWRVPPTLLLTWEPHPHCRVAVPSTLVVAHHCMSRDDHRQDGDGGDRRDNVGERPHELRAVLTQAGTIVDGRAFAAAAPRARAHTERTLVAALFERRPD